MSTSLTSSDTNLPLGEARAALDLGDRQNVLELGFRQRLELISANGTLHTVETDAQTIQRQQPMGSLVSDRHLGREGRVALAAAAEGAVVDGRATVLSGLEHAVEAALGEIEEEEGHIERSDLLRSNQVSTSIDISRPRPRTRTLTRGNSVGGAPNTQSCDHQSRLRT